LCLPSKPQISPSKARTAQQKGGICARLIMAGDGTYSWVFAKVGQSIWLAPALSKGGGKIPLILICLEHPWQHTVRATIVLGQNLI